jgi:hypothetical protein
MRSSGKAACFAEQKLILADRNAGPPSGATDRIAVSAHPECDGCLHGQHDEQGNGNKRAEARQDIEPAPP